MTTPTDHPTDHPAGHTTDHPTGPVRTGPTLADLDAAHRSLLGLLQGLSDTDLAAPSLLPGWTRAHVVAHLANHGIGTRHAVDALQDGREVPMYASPEAREADVVAVARRSPDQLRDLAEFGAREVTGALSTIRPEQVEETIERTPGGPRVRLGDLVATRIREVHVHAADLGASYGPEDWPAAFVDDLLSVLAWDRDVEVRRDGDRASASVEGREVSGSPARLAWWLLGRGAGEGLSCAGDLPVLAPWVRRAR